MNELNLKVMDKLNWNELREMNIIMTSSYSLTLVRMPFQYIWLAHNGEKSQWINNFNLMAFDSLEAGWCGFLLLFLQDTFNWMMDIHCSHQIIPLFSALLFSLTLSLAPDPFLYLFLSISFPSFMHASHVTLMKLFINPWFSCHLL